MPPKKSVTKKTTTAAKTARKPASKKVQDEPKKSFKELITEGLKELKSRKGTSRPALKKFIKEKYPTVAESSSFDHYFNSAIKRGVDAGEFDQPKGPSGTLKLAAPVKKEASFSKGRGKAKENCCCHYHEEDCLCR